MTALGVQVAVARADLILCQIGAWPWGWIGMAMVIAAGVIYAVKAVVVDGGVGN